MKIAVVGGAGFIGANFVYYWKIHHPEDQIIIIDSLTYAGHFSSIEYLVKSSQVQFWKTDIRNQSALQLFFNRHPDMDWIINFAAESHVDRSIANPEDFMTTNVLGTYNLLEAIRPYPNTKYHHISTDEVYGELGFLDTQGFTEQSHYRPNTPYAASKAASDLIALSYYHTYGTKVSVSNCSNNYGRYQDPEKFISRAITNLLEGKDIPIYGTGDNRRDWIHVEDHCSALECIITCDEEKYNKAVVGQKFNIGTNSSISNIEIAKKLLRYAKLTYRSMSDPSLYFVADRKKHDLVYQVDFSKMFQTFGWQPDIDLDRGLYHTFEWYGTNADWWQPIKEVAEKFYREGDPNVFQRNSL